MSTDLHALTLIELLEEIHGSHGRVGNMSTDLHALTLIELLEEIHGIHGRVGNMSTDWHVLMEHLEEIQSLCYVTRPSMASRAHQIFLIAGAVGYPLKVRPQEDDPPVFERLGDFFPYVHTLAQEAKQSISSGDAQQRHVLVAKAVMKIRSAMRKLKTLCEDHPTIESLSDTTASNEMNFSMKIVIKLFLPSLEVMEKRADFNHVPEFLHLHDLGIELLRENHLKAREFSLELDNKVMENQNTRQIFLKALHADGSRTACIFQKLQAADVPEFPSAPGQPSCPEKLLVCIDGNIGSRKSELMQKLLDINAQRAQQKVTVVREPLNQLSAKMIDFYRALDAGTDVTEEQRDQSSRFEEDMFDHHFNVATNTEIRTRHVIAERSMEAKIHVFNELNFLQGRLSEKSRDDMRRQFEEEVLGNPRCQPHAIIFCDISVKQAMERIKRRGREGEDKITLRSIWKTFSRSMRSCSLRSKRGEG